MGNKPFCPNPVDKGATGTIAISRCFPHNVFIDKMSSSRYKGRNEENRWAARFNKTGDQTPYAADGDEEEESEEEEKPPVSDNWLIHETHG